MPSTQIRTVQYDIARSGTGNDTQFGNHQASVILVAPDGFPTSKRFPSDTFSVTVDFHGDDGTFDTQTLNLKIETPPVVLIPGMLNNGSKTFGRYKNNGVWRALRAAGYTETDHIRIWDNDGQLGKGPSELLANGYNGLYKTLDDIFTWYAQRGITCARADIVAFGMGGLMARKFLEDKELKDNHTKYGDNWTVHSYRQGMVRRVITIAAPHRGTPWADSSDGRSFITTMYNAILDSPFYYNHPKFEAVLQPFILLANTVVGFSPYIFKNAGIANGSGWDDARTNAPRDYGFPSKVPMYSIVGEIHMGIAGGQDIFSVGSTILEKTTGINLDIKNYSGFGGWLLERNLLYRHPEMRALMLELEKFLYRKFTKKVSIKAGFKVLGKFLGVWGLIYDLPEFARALTDSLATAVFGLNNPNDLIVSTSSAVGDFEGHCSIYQVPNNELLDAQDKYAHWSICQQDDVGNEVAALLKGPVSKFKIFGSNYNASTARSANMALSSESDNRSVLSSLSASKSFKSEKIAETDDDDIENWEEFNFTEALNLKVEPSSFKLSGNEDTVTFSLTAEEPMEYDVYCAFSNGNNLWAFKMPASDDTKKTFKAVFDIKDIFASVDVGLIDINCFARDPNGIETSIYTSNIVNIAALPDEASINITKLEFADGLASIQTNIDSETELELYAFNYDGKIYDISSPLMGTEFKFDDPSIAQITDSGTIEGLKVGSTKLTASYRGASADITVIVGETETQEPQDPEEPVIAPEITTSSNLSVGTVNTSYSVTLSADGTTPISWTVSVDKLPDGLRLNESTGVITGTPEKSGTFNFTVQASNSAGTDTREFSIIINDVKPVINTASLPVGTVGTSYNATLSATGQNITWSGNSVNGLKVNSNGTITGVPSKSGTYKITVTAKNSGGSVSKTLSIVIKDVKPVIKTSSLSNGTTGTSYNATLSATGQNITWSGNSVNGLKVNSNGKITGTPTKAGTYKITVTAKNSGGSVSKTLSVVINDVKPVIKTSSLANGTTGTSYTATLSATGQNITWSGNSINGLTVNSNGKITGTPTKSGTYKITVTAKNSGGSVSKTLSVVIKDVKPVIKTSSLSNGMTGTSYNATLSATGGNVKWSISSGKLPTGLKLTASTGKITGKPTKAGTFSFKITAKNSIGSAVKTLKIVIKDAKPVIKTTSLNSGTVNKTYSATLKATGTNIKWSISGGKLPTGLKLTASTGKITGKPTKAGTFSFKVTAKSSTSSAVKTLKIVIKDAKPVIKTTSLSSGTINKTYSATLKATGTNIKWSISSGKLPTGLKLTASTGKITGKPTKAGTLSFTVMAKNSGGSVKKTLKITITKTKTASIAEFFNIFKVANDNNYEVENELDDVTPNDDLENSGENPEIDEEISDEESLETPENSENSVEYEINDNTINAELTLVNSADVNININADDEIYAASSTDLIFKIGTWTDVNGNNIEPGKIHVYVNDELDENINVKDNMFEISGISDDINVYVKADVANAELKSNTVFVTTDYNNIDSSNENGNSNGENSHANSNDCNAANSKFLIVLVVTAAFIKKFRFQNLR